MTWFLQEPRLFSEVVKASKKEKSEPGVPGTVLVQVLKLQRPLKSKLLKMKNGGIVPFPMEHLSRDPCGKWKLERDLQRAALKDKQVYLHSKVEKVKKKRSKCGWWGRRAAQKRRKSEIGYASEHMAPKKQKTKTKHNCQEKGKEVFGRANPFPTLDLTAKPQSVGTWWVSGVHERQLQRKPKMNSSCECFQYQTPDFHTTTTFPTFYFFILVHILAVWP